MLSGFTTTPLPAISAGIASEMAVAKGKFQGAMMPTTPLGWRISVEPEMTGTGPAWALSARSLGARLM